MACVRPSFMLDIYWERHFYPIFFHAALLRPLVTQRLCRAQIGDPEITRSLTVIAQTLVRGIGNDEWMV